MTSDLTIRIGLACCLISLPAMGTKPAGASDFDRNSGCVWQSGFHISGLADIDGLPGSTPTPLVRSAAVFDDGGGDGPALFAGGSFRTADDRLVEGLAKWNGETWSAVPGFVLPPSGSPDWAGVLAMTVFDDGDGAALYIGGDFGVQRWNDITWSTPGGGIHGSVRAFATGNLGGGPRLFAGGAFTSAGANPASNVAQWNGAAWSALGAGTDLAVSALTVWNDGGGNRLIAGGLFTTAGGTAASHVAKWNGAAPSGPPSAPESPRTAR